MKKLIKSIDPHKQVAKKLAEALVEDPPLVLRDGGIFRKGYSKELDDLRARASSGREWVTALETEEKKKTGIPEDQRWILDQRLSQFLGDLFVRVYGFDKSLHQFGFEWFLTQELLEILQCIQTRTETIQIPW